MAALNRPGAAPLAGGAAAPRGHFESAAPAARQAKETRLGPERSAAAPGGTSGGRRAAVTAVATAGPPLGSPSLPPARPAPPRFPLGAGSGYRAALGPGRAEEPAADARSLLSPVAGTAERWTTTPRSRRSGKVGAGSRQPPAAPPRAALGLRGAAEMQRNCTASPRGGLALELISLLAAGLGFRVRAMSKQPKPSAS